MEVRHHTIPAISTHQHQGEVAQEMAHIPANMVRLCVGGEHKADVIADLDQALAKAGKAALPSLPPRDCVHPALKDIIA